MSMSSRLSRFRAPRMPAAACALVVLCGVAPAIAQDAATIKRLEQMNKRAMEDYDLLEFDSARKTFPPSWKSRAFGRWLADAI